MKINLLTVFSFFGWSMRPWESVSHSMGSRLSLRAVFGRVGEQAQPLIHLGELHPGNTHK